MLGKLLKSGASSVAFLCLLVAIIVLVMNNGSKISDTNVRMATLISETNTRITNLNSETNTKIDDNYYNLLAEIGIVKRSLIAKYESGNKVLAKKIDDNYENLGNRIDLVHVGRAIKGKWLEKKSPHAIPTEKTIDLYLTEQEFTNRLYKIYYEDRTTFPENAFYTLYDSLGTEKMQTIINKYGIDQEILLGIIISFYGGVKHGDYLDLRPYLAE